MIAPCWALLVALPLLARGCAGIVTDAERYHRRRRRPPAPYRIEQDNVFYL
jgi:hypothetical protein